MIDLQHTLVPLAFFAGVVIIVIAILNFILKLRVLNTGVKDEIYIRLLTNSFESKANKSEALKWGLLLLFGGIGLVINQFIPGASYLDSPLPYGIEAIFISFGFLLYHYLQRNTAE
ncbi:hypothetical protein KHS38_16280 [Mucilaginibacter sp. Bleaf8]|uniref:hypothetical protein n=1 Tax=Mucilaginibacter sp. Bleaf8 TaxID=2834430 RepID=UPI001BCE4B2F|nr:hypothetical protein [Mucilaginibacter sp. Bleaf8]MBS7565966.1 hypothetical protein [Mucilaginibacter sp. Bleaf8]